jgi:hypothetical protein
VLKRLLESQGVIIDDARFSELRRRKPSRQMVEKLAAMASHLTRHFPAVHMTWGAINELSTLTGYHAMIERTRHAMVTTVMTRIIKDERRHFSFYFNQARKMLQDPAARRITSFVVRHFWTPVGSPVRGDADAHRICEFLFPGDEGRVRLTAMDEMIARLPGLEWFDLGTRYCGAARSKAPQLGSIPAHQTAQLARLARLDGGASRDQDSAWRSRKAHPGTVPIRIYARSRNQARMSAARSSGSSIAAKCPPFGITVQRLML